jgi:two-component system sensor histidine kinase RegB
MQWPTTQLEVLFQLLIDIAALTTLLYLSGGTTNPFASLYLIPIALAAVGLGWIYTVVITLACLGCYVWLMGTFIPLTFTQENLVAAFNLHILGMGVNFAVSASILAAVLATMAAEIRQRDQALAALREDVLRREHFNAMGLLAAGAAHELSTPLMAISMLAGELKSVKKVDARFREDLELLEKQVQLCKDKLSKVLQTAGQPRSPDLRTMPLRELLQEILDDWRALHPAIQLGVSWQDAAGEYLMQVDEGFQQALTNLLNNAADASRSNGSSQIRVSMLGEPEGAWVFIDDDGPGLSAEVRQQAGKAVFTTKPDGFGLGLVLSHANLNRLGCELTLTNRAERGTRTAIYVPAMTAGAGNAQA